MNKGNFKKFELKKKTTPIPPAKWAEEFQLERNKKIVLVIKDYKHKECSLNMVKSKGLLEKLEHLCTTTRETMIKDMWGNLKQIGFQGKENAYHSLLNGSLEQHRDNFYEVVCAGTNRVFGYFINNIFHIVLIKAPHFELKKK
jgi:hypothetical protein